ncbi:PPE family protein [Mycobacterium haemophilum DSM 44634]|nr:hypothetical protein B586_17035 [Mycobacterium haemophilum DSM 44634]
MINLAVQWNTRASETEGLFQGPAANEFRAKAGEYYNWLMQHVNTAHETAAYLHQAGQAYDAAVRSMVPYTTIAMNRTARLVLKATNLLGQFTTKISELDDEHQEMWAKNAEAMNTYQYAIFDITRRVQASNITEAPLILAKPSKPSIIFDDRENLHISESL